MPQVPGSNLTPLRLAVIGCGNMGRKHLQAARRVSGVMLSAVYDSNNGRAVEAGESFDVSIAASIEDACNNSDAAVIAAPTRAHNVAAKACLEAGLHCLVEKPLAASEAECREIIDTAAVKNLILQVGHVERFNPAVEALLEQNIASKDIHSITARRMNPGSGRIIEDDVVLDLMVHDLDLIAALKCAPVVSISARNLGAEHSEASLAFADGSTAIVTANRNAAAQTRDVEIVANGGAVHVDYAKRAAWTNIGVSTGANKNERRELPVGNGDPLEQQLAHFAACIRGAHEPRVSGEQALATMKLAWRIQAALKSSA
jgi:predicted dehydrogenase